MLTTPITTPSFHARVLILHANCLKNLGNYDSSDLPTPIIGALSSVDTPLGPAETVSQLLGIISPWIDLCSPDPLIYGISRQVLELEVSYAAFCGLGNVLIPGPRLHHGKKYGDGLMQYALAIQDTLGASNYLQIEIQLPMVDYADVEKDLGTDSLAYLAREEYVGAPGSSKAKKSDVFGSWDAWNMIRVVCKHNPRLFVGEQYSIHLNLLYLRMVDT